MDSPTTTNPVLEVIFTPEEIARRLVEMAHTIKGDSLENLMVVAILKGSFVFAADLIRALHRVGLAPEVDFMTLSSYRKARISGGQVSILRDMDLEVTDRNVMIIDDVLDSGRTLAFAKDLIAARGAKSIKTCVLLDKQAPRAVQLQPTIVPSSARMCSWSATAWTWRTATASCPSSGASCASERVQRKGDKWRGYCWPTTTARRVIWSSARWRATATAWS